MYFSNFKSQIAAGDTLQAMRQFQEAFEKYSQECLNSTTLMLSRWRTTEKEAIEGVLTDDEANAGKNTITKDFLCLLDNIYNDFQAYYDQNDQTLAKKEEPNRLSDLVTERSHGKYIIRNKTKDGAKWSNFLGYDEILKRDVIIKIQKLDQFDPEDSITDRKAILLEKDRVNQMKHPNIIKLVDVYYEKSPYFVVTDYIWGVSISELTTSIGSLPYNLALHILIDLCEVLEYLRAKKIYHTALQPGKILLNENNRPMLSPFEIIKANERDLRTAQVNYCKYLSPEILNTNQDPDIEPDTYREAVASDQFSLGLLAYEMLVGAPLFLGNSITEVIESRSRFFTDDAVKETKWEHLRREGCPPEVITLIKQMLQEKPEDRLPSISNLSDELNLLKPNLHKHQRILLSSYNRILAANPEFSSFFYEAFFNKMGPETRNRFKDLDRQKKMLQLAQRAFLESGGSADFIDRLPTIPDHKGVTLEQYGIFLETLHEVAQAADPEWLFPGVSEAWEETKKNALTRLAILLE